ncbi:hypothetical protein PR048_010809 [Dryococelus australis]|uniref:PiggyBac transposable element-derived protein domain-containing protein n=1 Tax=Dryococelus australis TaxID=614101 RepID=A0ABQ9I5P5_9NEOP|nr:hypothetical protein PR048_010809 [Dryococelus australis]
MPVDIFLLPFPEELIEKIAFQTNLCATQKHGGINPAPTTSQEIKEFLAITILMGVKKLPSYRDYWSSDSKLRHTFISSIMSLNRFSLLLGYLHFNDISEQEHKGRSTLKQYDAKCYMCKFEVYTGKMGNLVERDLGGRVVKTLCQSLENKGYEVYLDNYFTSVGLMQKKTYACGTVGKNRKNLPKDLKTDKQLHRRESDWKETPEGITYMKWMDRKRIYFLSNFYDAEENSTARRKKNFVVQAL